MKKPTALLTQEELEFELMMQTREFIIQKEEERYFKEGKIKEHHGNDGK